MKDVVIISNYWHFDFEKSSSRYLTIAHMAAEAGALVEVITSTFYHTAKRQRDTRDLRLQRQRYTATLLYEPGYKKNITIKRVFSHGVFAANVLKYLRGRKPPDVIYLAVPPLGLAGKVLAYANGRRIRAIIDVQDVWPEAFHMLLPFPKLLRFVLAPLYWQANRIYAGADDIAAVSQTYLQRAMGHNKRRAKGHCVFIGTDLGAFDSFASCAQAAKPADAPVALAYIGMLGHSYDLIGVMDAMCLQRESGGTPLELLVMGDGPLRQKLERYALKKRLPVAFTGRLSYEDMVKRLVRCDIAISPIVPGGAQSIINKHADYVSAGLPIISIQDNPEFGILLTQFNAGINCTSKNIPELADALERLASDAGLRKAMGINSRRLAEEKFDRNVTYPELVDAILKKPGGSE